MSTAEMLHCDAFGCTETHPVEHDAMTEPGFRFGKWLGWLYLDINRPDLVDRQLRFCSVFCLRHWLNMHVSERPVGYGAELENVQRLRR
jgi:hypothetical protein